MLCAGTCRYNRDINGFVGIKISGQLIRQFIGILGQVFCVKDFNSIFNSIDENDPVGGCFSVDLENGKTGKFFLGPEISADI